jgi:hypothetical protein
MSTVFFPISKFFLSLELWCHWQYIMGMSTAPKRKHDKPLQIRMNEELLLLIQSASDKAGLSTSGWVRDRMARVARREIRQSGDDTPRRSNRDDED